MKTTSLCNKSFFFAILFGFFCNGLAQEVSTHRNIYLPNEPIRVSFSNAPGNVADWLGLYKEGDSHDKLIDWQYLDGSQNYQAPVMAGERVFSAGLKDEGSYEVRLYENDGYSLLASYVFTVANSPRVSVEASPINPGTPINVSFINGPANPKDWVGIVAANAPDTILARLYTDGTTTGTSGKASGSLSFSGINQSGNYEVRYFSNDTTDLLDRVPLVIGYPKPEITAVPGNQNVTLKWPALSWPIAIEKYAVLILLPNGTYQPVAEVSPQTGENQYVHENQNNGSERCYVVLALGTGGQAMSESDPICTAPYGLPTGQIVSYDVQPGTDGTQAWPGALGMDFQTVNPISVVRLGVFDDGSDGLDRTIVARLYNRSTKTELASVEFTPASPGELIGGSRFKTLSAPVRLESGFQGTIVAEGYGPEEKAANAWFQAPSWKLADGDGSVVYLGKSRYGEATKFPERVDNGPANRYGAGTFAFEVLEVIAPGKPILSVMPDDKAAELSWPAVTRPLPAAKYRIFRADNPDGPFTQIAEVTTTSHRDTGLVNGTPVSYKVQAVTGSGVPGPESDVVTRVPNVVQAGVAYIAPAETAGNQSFGGSVGNDFDVVRPIRITRLGAFDDMSDGLKRTITVRLYNRATQTELVRMTFNPGEGSLVDGSRFKDLPTPIILQPGFQGAIIASGYGEDEKVGNGGIPGTADLNLVMFTGGSLEFVGSARFGLDPNAYPDIPDGGPENRYAAGTFYFEPYTVVSTTLTISRSNDNKVVITWTGPGVLESTGAIGGTWNAVPNAVSGIQITPTEQAQIYRLKL